MMPLAKKGLTVFALILWLIAGIWALPAITGCSNDAGPDAQTQGGGGASADPPVLNVVATSNIVADWAGRVGGERVELLSLVPIGVDPHSFQPGARDVARIGEADIVFTVGLGLESGWLNELIDNVSDGDPNIVELAERIEPIEFVELAAHVGHAHGKEDDGGGADVENGRRSYDPHFWFDPARVKIAVNEIAARLTELDPDGAAAYASNAEGYSAKLDELHSWTLEQVNALPAERRLLITSHDSLSYFAQVYGFEVIGAVIPTSLSTEVEPSAERLALLAEDIEYHGVPAVFGEVTVSERLASTIAAETGAALVRLHSGSLGEKGSGSETYIGMMRTNVNLIVGALR